MASALMRDSPLTPLLARVGGAHSWLNSTPVYSSLFVSSLFRSTPASYFSADRLADTALLRRPFTIFAVIHAVRIACVYRGIARAGGYDRQLGGKWSCAAADATFLFRFAPTWRLTTSSLQTCKRRLFRSC